MAQLLPAVPPPPFPAAAIAWLYVTSVSARSARSTSLCTAALGACCSWSQPPEDATTMATTSTTKAATTAISSANAASGVMPLDRLLGGRCRRREK
jgi:hypothetical protein